MREVTVFFGGSVGSDPLSPKTWSGTGPFLVKAMQSAGLLDRAVGIEPPSWRKRLLLLKNFHRNRTVWRQHFYADPAYRDALTAAAGKVPVASAFLLQPGSMFSLPDAFPAKKCISYHDGNLAELLKSGYNTRGVSAKRMDQSLRYEEAVSNRMTAVFTFSEYLRQSFIRDYHVPEAKVFNVGGGINLSTFPEPDPAKDYTANRILFIGTQFERKGGPQLLEAFRIVRQSIPNAELRIVGPAIVSGLPPGAVAHGHLSKTSAADAEKLEALFRDSTLFALPSLYEPFGIAPLEAMLYGIPCVVTDAWALAESVTPGRTGALVEKGSVPDLAAKLIQMLTDPERLRKMGREGREQVLARYTWPTVAGRMSSIIETL